MLFRANRSFLFACSRGRAPVNRFSSRQRGVESLESRLALSTVSSVSASDAAVGGQGVDEEQSAMVADGPTTAPTPGEGSIAATHCPAGETSLIDWSQTLVKEETPKEKLARLKERLEELEETLKDLDKQWKKLSREYDDLHDKLAEKDPPPSSEEVARLEKRLKEIDAEGDKIEAEQKEINDEIGKLKDEIEELEKDLGQDRDQDDDGVPDNLSAHDAADHASLTFGDLLDVCLPPAEWDALAAAYWGDGGTGHIDLFDWPSEGDAFPVALPYDLSNLDNDTGAIDFVRWGAVDVPSHTDLGDIDLDDFESRRSLFIGELP